MPAVGRELCLVDLGKELDALARDVGLDPGDGFGYRDRTLDPNDAILAGTCR